MAICQPLRPVARCTRRMNLSAVGVPCVAETCAIFDLEREDYEIAATAALIKRVSAPSTAIIQGMTASNA